MTCSTPARLYQLRSSSTISPAAGRFWTYRWKYHCVRCRSVGAGSATMRAVRGLRYSVTRLMVLPFPAASRPSKITTTLAPSDLTHSCSFTSSAWSRNSSFSYTFRGNRPPFPFLAPITLLHTRPRATTRLLREYGADAAGDFEVFSGGDDEGPYRGAAGGDLGVGRRVAGGVIVDDDAEEGQPGGGSPPYLRGVLADAAGVDEHVEPAEGGGHRGHGRAEVMDVHVEG